MPKPQLLLRIGAEGGSIEVYGDKSSPATPRFRAVVTDQTLTFLNEDDRGKASRRDSGWLATWLEAMTWISRYPWPHLVPLLVDASVQCKVWTALEARLAQDNPPIRPRNLDRWKRACN